MREKVLVSTFTLIGSLASYYYGKTHDKDIAPFVMVGGFIGAWVGEFISKNMEARKNNKPKKD